MAQSKNKLNMLTLNTHSLMMPDNAFCLRELARAIQDEHVDVIALQEVNQAQEEPLLSEAELEKSGFRSCGSVIRRGNYVYTLACMLREDDPSFSWSWAFAHMGYKTYEEGLAILCRGEMTDALAIPASPRGTHCARVVLTAVFRGMAFSTVHFGWWTDERDPFVRQWSMASEALSRLQMKQYMLGDFNNPSNRRSEGYDLITSCGWHDCYARALERDDGVTVSETIDGWRDHKVDPMRIDLVFSSAEGATLSSRVIFNGVNRPVISDHFGVLTREE